MYSKNGAIIIEEIMSYSPGAKETFMRDQTGIQFMISNKDLIRLYEGLKYTVEKTLKKNFDEYCNSLF